MTTLFTIFRTTISAGAIATVALAGAAHADTREIAKYNPKSNTYCVSEMVTDSILPHRICATRQEWIDGGATIVPSPARQIAMK